MMIDAIAEQKDYKKMKQKGVFNDRLLDKESFF